MRERRALAVARAPYDTHELVSGTEAELLDHARAHVDVVAAGSVTGLPTPNESGAATQNLDEAQGSRFCFQFCGVVGELCEEFLFRRLVLSFLTWRTMTAAAAPAALVARRLVTVSLALWFIWRFGHVLTHVAEYDIRFEKTAHGCP